MTGGRDAVFTTGLGALRLPLPPGGWAAPARTDRSARKHARARGRGSCYCYAGGVRLRRPHHRAPHSASACCSLRARGVFCIRRSWGVGIVDPVVCGLPPTCACQPNQVAVAASCYSCYRPWPPPLCPNHCWLVACDRPRPRALHRLQVSGSGSAWGIQFQGSIRPIFLTVYLRFDTILLQYNPIEYYTLIIKSWDRRYYRGISS